MSRELDALIAELLATWIQLKRARARRHGAQAFAIRRQLDRHLDELVEMTRDKPQTDPIEICAAQLAARHESSYSISYTMLKLLRLIEGTNRNSLSVPKPLRSIKRSLRAH